MTKPSKAIRTTVVPASARNAAGKPRRAGMPPDRARITDVENLLALLYSDQEIQRRVAAKFGVAERTVRSDLTRVYAELHERASATRDARVARARHTAEAMFRSSLSAGDRRDAQGYFDKLCRIEGTYAPDALKLLTAEIDGMQRLSAGDLDAEIERELVKTLAGLPEERRAAVLAKVTS